MPLIAAGVAGACAAGAVVAAGAVATGFEVLLGLVAFVVATAVLDEADADEDDEADALDVTPDPAIGPPAMFIALVDPN